MKRCEYCDRPLTITSFSDLHGLGPTDVCKHIRSYQSGLDQDPDNATWHSSLAMCYLKLGLHAEAVTHFEEAMDLEPANSELYFYCAVASLAGKRPFTAGLVAVKRACELARAARKLEVRGTYSIFLGYLYRDYYARRSLNPPTSESEAVAAARQSGVSAADRQLMTEMLGEGFAAYSVAALD
jgi:tetratricopeptide (TPR) repeat protein